MRTITLCICTVLAWMVHCAYCAAQSSPTAFTYQGQLLSNGLPANGYYDLQFALADAMGDGNYLGSPITNAPVSVNNGIFTVILDFGSQVFGGSGTWLEIGVRTNGSTDPYAVLAPRQPLTPAPYAIYALGAASAGLASNLAPGAVISGNGAGITNAPYASSNNVIQAESDATNQSNTKIANNAGAGTNNQFLNPIFWASSVATGIAVTNAQLAGGTFQSGNDLCLWWFPTTGTNSDWIQFNGPNGNFGALGYISNHDGDDGSDPETIILSSGSIALKPNILGGGFGWPQPANRHIQMGGPNDYRVATMIGNDHLVAPDSPLGWSDPLMFQAQVWSNGPAAIFPGWQLWMTDTNGNGALELFPNIDETIYPPFTNWSHAGQTPVAQFRVEGNGTTTNQGLDVWGTVNVYGSVAVTSGLSVAGAPITNNGMVWLALATNDVPSVTLPNGSVCTTTNGNFYIYSNGWQKVF